MSLTRQLACIAALASATATAPALATLIEGNIANSVAHSGATFGAELSYSAAAATLTIDLQNNSPIGVSGTLSAFIVNNPADSDKVPAGPTPELSPTFALIAGVMLLALRLRRRLPPG